MSKLLAVAYVVLLVLAVARSVRWRRVVRADGAFRCRIRLTGGRCARWRWLGRRWSRRLMCARWMDDELVVWRSPLFRRPVRLSARVGSEGVRRLAVLDVTRCGCRPVVVEFEISDGSRIEVVTRESDRRELVGPYLAAAMADLPPAPRPRRHIRGPGW
jgi:hypothetical protein